VHGAHHGRIDQTQVAEQSMVGGARRAHIDVGHAVGHHWAGCAGPEQISVGHTERTSGRVGSVGGMCGAGHAGLVARPGWLELWV
jgi:hypothetical protein